MKKLNGIALKGLFFKHATRFLDSVSRPNELRGGHAIAVSGGIDSMMLLWFAHELFQEGKIGPVRALFVHHHTRPGQDAEASVVLEFCQQRQIPFVQLDAIGLKNIGGNFEQEARKQRRALLLSELKPGELLWMGHHLDDSYEWSLMQKYRSGSPKSSLGIPVRNGPIIRPFLCVSKKQLIHLNKFEKVPYLEDPTNTETRFDRNFLRQEILPLISKRYPQYLKHYVNHANYLATILNLTISGRINHNLIHVYDHGAIIQGLQFSPYQVQDLLHSFSENHRGKTTSQIFKMIKAIENGKKGPFHFSGGTEIYFSYKLLMIYSQRMKNYDSSIAGVLRGLTNDELMLLPSLSHQELLRVWDTLLKSSDAMLNMPGLLVIIESQSVNKTLNTSVYDSLFPEVSKVCHQRGLRFLSSLKCLETWERKKEKLPEKLRILPLWTLSNLFSSQE
jgi:tRNA(Ile)-lysidine synthase